LFKLFEVYSSHAMGQGGVQGGTPYYPGAQLFLYAFSAIASKAA